VSTVLDAIRTGHANQCFLYPLVSYQVLPDNFQRPFPVFTMQTRQSQFKYEEDPLEGPQPDSILS